MKLGLVTLVIIGALLMGSEACVKLCGIARPWFTPPCCVWYSYRLIVPVCLQSGCGKRSMLPKIEFGIPCKFSDYDHDKDGKVTKDEFLKTLNMKSIEAGMVTAFKEADKNSDGTLSCAEFRAAPFEYRCKPTGCLGAETQDEPFDTE